MATNYLTPNMNLLVPVVGQELGPTWAQDLNTSLSTIDAHNHSFGSGVQINPSGMDINSDLSFNGNNGISFRSVRFMSQGSPISGPSDLGCLYESGPELYYNDGNGNQVQITNAGNVNATSSGISSGTASASFVSSVLVVNAASLTPANIQVASVLLGKNSSGTAYLTLSPPSSLSSNYTLTLPAIPLANSYMTMDTSGNMGTTPITNPISNQAVFTTSGSWTPPASITATTIVKVTVIGGGGGGATGITGESGGSGGGGAGSCILWIAGSALSSPETITIGAGGLTGSDGGASSFGSHCSAGGGLAGSSSGNENGSPGGAPGTATGGTINMTGGGGVGSGGATGDYGSGFGGSGGAAAIMSSGGSGAPTQGNINGGPGGGFGGGGGGSSENTGWVGGAGSGGLVLIEWFG